ncbi:hypothetical protein [Aliikangiella coralliicola]|uniref:TIGR03016 family PEP-CTERM system-associated outer membrane protein n=1 Tax=Aliikangiella coralliicola TaxID=2592383 RepID=A0A545UHE5_9GAMM|nr:hypothetical protein [Aliikangiella coralliicola]TQV88880.1 hypothetical protein FLL46_04925 [Aliikangiella coralliicola]
MKNNKYLSKIKTVAAFAILGQIYSVHSLEYAVSVSTETEYSDNISQALNSEEGDRLSLELGFTLSTENTKSWDINLSGAYSDENYSVDSLADQTNKEFDARVFYRPPTSNFRLLFLESYTIVPRNRFAVENVDNTRNINVATLRPSYFFNVTSGDKLNIEVSKTDLDNDEIEGAGFTTNGSRQDDEISVSWERVINANTFLSIVRNDVKVDYSASMAEGAVDYDQIDTFISYRRVVGMTQYQLDFGRSELTNQLGQKSEDELITASLGRQINRTHFISFSGRKGFDSLLGTDIATETVDVINPTNEFQSASKVREINFGYAIEDNTDSLSFSLFDRELIGVDSTDEEKRQGLTAQYSVSMSRYFNTPLESNIEIGYSLAKSDFSITGVNTSANSVENLRLRYNHNQTRALSYYAEISRRLSYLQLAGLPEEKRDSSSIVIGVRYNFTPR